MISQSREEKTQTSQDSERYLVSEVQKAIKYVNQNWTMYTYVENLIISEIPVLHQKAKFACLSVDSAYE